MATIERIRQRSGLLIVVVFVALMAFLLGDLFQSGGSRFFGDPNVVGSVNGVELSRMEMSQKIEELRTGNPETYANSRDRKSTRLNSSHSQQSRMPSSA